MSAAIAICTDTDREHWLSERRSGIGASDTPQILGLASFGGPAKVAAAKLGYEVEDIDSELLRWGRLVEPSLIAAFEDETGIAGQLDGTLYRSPEREHMLATLDGTCEVEGVTGALECKFVRYTSDRWEQGVPAAVEAQVQHQLYVTGFPFAYVLALLDGYKFRWARVERDDDFMRKVLLPSVDFFWKRLQAGERIEPKGAPDAEYEALKQLYPEAENGVTARLEGEKWVEKFTAWKDASARKGAAEKEAKAIRNEFFAAIGSAEFALLDNGQRLSLKTQTRKAHQVAESTFRTLRGLKD